jgi:hypothetical protein
MFNALILSYFFSNSQRVSHSQEQEVSRSKVGYERVAPFACFSPPHHSVCAICISALCVSRAVSHLEAPGSHLSRPPAAAQPFPKVSFPFRNERRRPFCADNSIISSRQKRLKGQFMRPDCDFPGRNYDFATRILKFMGFLRQVSCKCLYRKEIFGILMTGVLLIAAIWCFFDGIEVQLCILKSLGLIKSHVVIRGARLPGELVFSASVNILFVCQISSHRRMRISLVYLRFFL